MATRKEFKLDDITNKTHQLNSSNQTEKPLDDLKQLSETHFSLERETWFSHFSNRLYKQLSTESVVSTKFSTDASLLACSMQDGQIQIISSNFNTTLYSFDSDSTAKEEHRTCFPVTGLAWKHVKSMEEDDMQVLMGSMCDGSVMRWTPSMNNSCDKIPLNPKNQYQCIDYSGDGKRFCVAGLLPQIEIYDDETMQPIQVIGGGGKTQAH